MTSAWMRAFLDDDEADPVCSVPADRPEGRDAICPICTNCAGSGETEGPADDPNKASDLKDAYEERAAILEFGAGLPRAEAERLAWGEVYGQASRTE